MPRRSKSDAGEVPAKKQKVVKEKKTYSKKIKEDDSKDGASNDASVSSLKFQHLMYKTSLPKAS